MTGRRLCRRGWQMGWGRGELKVGTEEHTGWLVQVKHIRQARR